MFKWFKKQPNADKTDQPIPLPQTIKSMRCNKGDTIVIEYDGILCAEQRNGFVELFRNMGFKVIVLENKMKLAAVLENDSVLSNIKSTRPKNVRSKFLP